MTTSLSSGPIDGASRSFREWSHVRPLSEALARAEADVRVKPQEVRARWLLFELSCVLGQWERALKQLQTWAGLSRDNESTAHVMRGLIRAEHQRMELFAGRAEPATLAAGGRSAPAWMAGLGEALRLAAPGDAAAVEAADLARETALGQAPDTAGVSNLMSFAWVSDSDTRLGPVCEVILAGAYRWLAFRDLASIAKAAPAHLLDLVWVQVDLVLRDGTALKGYMPTRYPVHAGDRDALLMARETVWTDVGQTGVIARGQKMWATDAGDMALLDLRDCKFAVGA
ncbi:type VI secretion system accessory protein TagJ [Variovorax humicola]|uniref:Type VI secretion system accessory protein TagJ n=1 Tax=Variovorax humicola TaxID=1769758 RepID=A0ABU8WB85_9BURK